MTENSIKNNKALEIFNDKLLEILIDKGIIASQLLFLLSKITSSKNNSHIELMKDYNSNWVNDLLINKKPPVTPDNNLLTFRDKDKKPNYTAIS